jgi:CHAT domain-containing protein
VKSTADRVATIYPIVIDDAIDPNQNRLQLILKRPNGQLEAVAVAVDRPTLGRAITALRPLLSKRDLADPATLQTAAGQLYTWLIAPLQSQLQADGVNTLVFVPDSLLRNIPMGALYQQSSSDKPGRYLVQDYAIAVSLPGYEKQSKAGIDPSTARILAAGVNQERKKVWINGRCRHFDELTKVDEEIAAISGLLQNRVTTLLKTQSKTLKTTAEFTAKNFEQILASSDYSIVHLATHGEFSSNPQETFILTAAGDPVYISDLQETLKSRLDGTMPPIELLVLSACQTATGDAQAGLGMAGVAVRSGARSTLASLWTVNDESTSKLMQYFYQELLQPQTGKQSKARALQQAQLRLMESRESDYTKPYYWAPFVLVGSWQ